MEFTTVVATSLIGLLAESGGSESDIMMGCCFFNRDRKLPTRCFAAVEAAARASLDTFWRNPAEFPDDSVDSEERPYRQQF